MGALDSKGLGYKGLGFISYKGLGFRALGGVRVSQAAKNSLKSGFGVFIRVKVKERTLRNSKYSCIPTTLNLTLIVETVLGTFLGNPREEVRISAQRQEGTRRKMIIQASIKLTGPKTQGNRS